MNRSVLNRHRPNDPHPNLSKLKANVMQLCTQSIYSRPFKNGSQPYEGCNPKLKSTEVDAVV